MNDVVIHAEGLGKSYLIGHQANGKQNTTFRDAMTRGVQGFVRSTRDMMRGRQLVSGDVTEEYWALKDVNFEIKRGDVVGIIGRNGAGKSTLLKIISRITEPTQGRVTLKGRIASLLEVGTGFHPELSGRENIFLNGAILGMSKAEISRKFDEIVAFAEVDKFLDTPVKHYSSGMYVRLAFAVAAHLEPEILIIDEVLAVGDAEFQKKCLGKMGEVAGQGRTVLFVSHNIAAINELTSTGILLSGGTLAFKGPSSRATELYLGGNNSTQHTFSADGEYTKPHLAEAAVITATHSSVHIYGASLKFRFSVKSPIDTENVCFSFHIINEFGVSVAHCYVYKPDLRLRRGENILECELKHARLNVGNYRITTYLAEPPGGNLWDCKENICGFSVERADKNPYWGWRASSCTYFEDYEWSIADGK